MTLLLVSTRVDRRSQSELCSVMRPPPPKRSAAAFVLALGVAWTANGASAEEREGPAPRTIDRIPPGFSLSLVTDEVKTPRQMALADSGTLFVGTGRHTIYAVVIDGGWPKPSAGEREGPALRVKEPEVVVVDQGLNEPAGLALHDGDLYAATNDSILRYPNIETTFRAHPDPQIVTDALPANDYHRWKSLSIGPDGYLYVPIGSPCDSCLSEDPRYASILRMDPNTGETSVYAHGVRNSVGMAWHPQTGELWFSDNGRQMLGDDLPPDEINRAPTPGAHYGFPHIHGAAVSDPDLGDGHHPADYVAPVFEIQAHSSVLGIAFYNGRMFPSQYAGALFMAEHGSSERSVKVGYRVSVLRFGESGVEYAPFVDVWLDGQKSNARPNDVLVAADGSLLISDDGAGGFSDDGTGGFLGRIHRVSYAPP